VADNTAEILSLVVPASGTLDVRKAGRFFSLIETSAAYDVIAYYRGQQRRFAQVQQGVSIEGMPFDRLRIVGAAGAIQIGIATEPGVRIRDSRPTVNATVNTTIAPAAAVNALADVSVGDGAGAILVAGSNANRLELTVRVPITSPVGVRLGGSGMLSGEGVLLEPGDGVVLAHEGALYARNDSGSGSAADVTVTELTT
jgi:hypothetical protein